MYEGRQFSPWNPAQGTRRQTTKGQTSLRGDPGESLFSCSLFLGSFPKGMPEEYRPSPGTHLIGTHYTGTLKPSPGYWLPHSAQYQGRA